MEKTLSEESEAQDKTADGTDGKGATHGPNGNGKDNRERQANSARRNEKMLGQDGNVGRSTHDETGNKTDALKKSSG